MGSILANAYSFTLTTLPGLAIIAALRKEALRKPADRHDIFGNSLLMPFSPPLVRARVPPMESYRAVATTLRPPGFASLVPATRR
jgi:hypothetical protein